MWLRHETQRLFEKDPRNHHSKAGDYRSHSFTVYKTPWTRLGGVYINLPSKALRSAIEIKLEFILFWLDFFFRMARTLDVPLIKKNTINHLGTEGMKRSKRQPSQSGTGSDKRWLGLPRTTDWFGFSILQSSCWVCSLILISISISLLLIGRAEST